MKIWAALAAADAGEGGNGIPIAVAVTENNEAHVNFTKWQSLAKFPCHFLLDKHSMRLWHLLICFIEIDEKSKFAQITF